MQKAFGGLSPKAFYPCCSALPAVSLLAAVSMPFISPVPGAISSRKIAVSFCHDSGCSAMSLHTPLRPIDKRNIYSLFCLIGIAASTEPITDFQQPL